MIDIQECGVYFLVNYRCLGLQMSVMMVGGWVWDVGVLVVD